MKSFKQWKENNFNKNEIYELTIEVEVVNTKTNSTLTWLEHRVAYHKDDIPSIYSEVQKSIEAQYPPWKNWKVSVMPYDNKFTNYKRNLDDTAGRDGNESQMKVHSISPRDLQLSNNIINKLFQGMKNRKETFVLLTDVLVKSQDKLSTYKHLISRLKYDHKDMLKALAIRIPEIKPAYKEFIKNNE